MASADTAYLPPAADKSALDDVFADGCISVPEAAEFTGMSRSDLYDRMGRGELIYSKVGRRRLVPRRALVNLLRGGAVGAG